MSLTRLLNKLPRRFFSKRTAVAPEGAASPPASEPPLEPAHAYPLLGPVMQRNLHRALLAVYRGLQPDDDARLRNQLEWMVDHAATSVFLAGERDSHDAMCIELKRLRQRVSFLRRKWPPGQAHGIAQFFEDFSDLVEYSRSRTRYALEDALSDAEIEALATALRMKAAERAERYGGG